MTFVVQIYANAPADEVIARHKYIKLQQQKEEEEKKSFFFTEKNKVSSRNDRSSALHYLICFCVHIIDVAIKTFVL